MRAEIQSETEAWYLLPLLHDMQQACGSSEGTKKTEELFLTSEETGRAVMLRAHLQHFQAVQKLFQRLLQFQESLLLVIILVFLKGIERFNAGSRS